MRRLPVYFVIDVSESMVGEPIEKVEQGLRSIITDLKKDPYALETVYISIIVFAGKSKTLVPLTDIISFYPPRFSIGAGTSFGKAMKNLMDDINRYVKKTTLEEKGDWKPIVFFMTDGNPTDDYRIDLLNWEQRWKDKMNTIVISIGDNANHSILTRISDNIIAFDDNNTQSFSEFFKWVTASIKMQSQKVDETGNDSGFGVGNLNNSANLKKIDPVHESDLKNMDDVYAIFLGKCQNTKKEYLIKYKKGFRDAGFIDMPELTVETYRLQGAYILDKAYYELSDEQSRAQMSRVSTEELRGVPNCPACNNRFAMAICDCSNIFCLDGDGEQTCPHCGISAFYGRGDGHIDIDRQQG